MIGHSIAVRSCLLETWRCCVIGGSAAGLAILVLIGGAERCSARTEPNISGRALPLIDDVDDARDQALRNPAKTLASRHRSRAGTASATRVVGPAATAVVNVPLPAGAVQIDSTYYDLQDLGSLGTRIVIAPSGVIHATWEDDFCELDPNGCPPNPNAPLTFPQRGMAYAYRMTSGQWVHVGKVQEPSIRCTQCSGFQEAGGFGTIALSTDGRAAISQHMIEDGCDLRGDFYLEDAVGGASWTAYLTPISSPSFLFPQVVALPNGSYVVLGEAIRVTSDCVHCGTSDFRVSRLGSAGSAFVCPTGWQCGPWTAVAPLSLYRNGFPAFPSLATDGRGRVGIAVTDFGGNAFLIESSDGTFNAGTITIRNLTQNSDATITAPDSTSGEYRPYIHCHLAYNDTTPHVVWSELQARRSGSTIAYFDYRSRIRHWDPVSGLSVVKRVQPGEADHYDDIDNGLSGPIAGFNTISVDWPQVGFSADGSETYVVWVRFVDSEVDPTADAGLPGIVTGIGFGDVAASVMRSGGNWSAAQNLTQTPNTDERYVSLAARNDSGKAHVLFQASATDEAGTVQAQDRGTTSALLLRRIAYLERRLSASLVDVSSAPSPLGTLRVFPNPASGRVRFALGPAAGPSAAAAVLVFSVDGRMVARISAAGSTAEWDGRDRFGRPAASGVYLARIEGRDEAPVKLLLLH